MDTWPLKLLKNLGFFYHHLLLNQKVPLRHKYNIMPFSEFSSLGKAPSLRGSETSSLRGFQLTKIQERKIKYWNELGNLFSPLCLQQFSKGVWGVRISTLTHNRCHSFTPSSVFTTPPTVLHSGSYNPDFPLSSIRH